MSNINVVFVNKQTIKRLDERGEYKARKAIQEDAFAVDVRMKGEVEKQSKNELDIKGGLVNIPFLMKEENGLVNVAKEIRKQWKESGKDALLMQCSSGRRTLKIAQAMRSIANMEGDEEKGTIYLHIENLTDRQPTMIQLFDRESCTFTYIVADEESKQAVIIDSVNSQTDRDYDYLNKFNDYKTVGIMETHIHADHITGSHKLNQKMKENNRVENDIYHYASLAANVKPEERPRFRGLKDLDFIQVGKYFLIVRETPGHTDTCLSYVTNNLENVTTGDVLFIRGCGRTDFQAGDPKNMYHSIQTVLYKGLPDETKVYPGHDYKGCLNSTIGHEKKFNPRCPDGQTVEGFEKIMNNLNLNPPAKIKESVPGNLELGHIEE